MWERKHGELGVTVLIRMFKLLFVRSKPSTKTSGDAAAQWISNPWHAVSIVVSERACQSARNAAHKRFLSGEAPVLPLAACAARNCTCRYRHHQDRRDRPRRRVDVVGTMARWAGVERRSGGRRATD